MSMRQNETALELPDLDGHRASRPWRESPKHFRALSTEFEPRGGLCTGQCHSCNTPWESSICACGKGVFFIACQFPWAKVAERRRGASPSRPALESRMCLGFWWVRGGIRGLSGGEGSGEDRNPPPEVNTEEQQ